VEHICKDDVSILHRAQSGILVYEITDDHNGEYSMSVWAEDNGDTFMLAEDVKDTLDQAKAAAQADYEARTAERFRAIELAAMPCPKCTGHGYRDEHDPDDPHDFACCTSCPIQVPCEYCHANGELNIVYNKAIAKAKEQI
jgi:hypothetical protein